MMEEKDVFKFRHGFLLANTVSDGGDSSVDDLDFFGSSDFEGQETDDANTSNNDSSSQNQDGQNSGNDQQQPAGDKVPADNRFAEIQRRYKKSQEQIEALQQQVQRLAGLDSNKVIKPNEDIAKKYPNYDPNQLKTIQEIARESNADLRQQLESTGIANELQNYFNLHEVPSETRRLMNNALNNSSNGKAVRDAIMNGALSFEDMRMVFDYPRAISALKTYKVKFENLQNQYANVSKGTGAGADVPAGAPDFANMPSDLFKQWQKDNS